MGFIVFGVMALIVGMVFSRINDKIRLLAKPITIGGTVLILIGIMTACIVQIDAGYIGVQKLFGKIQNGVLQSGLHFINPMINVIHVDTKTQNYTMSGVHDEGNQVGDDAMRVLTADGLEVIIDLTVLYRVIPSDAPKLLQETGLDYNVKVVRPIARTGIRDNAVYYDAVSLYSVKRDEFQIRIFNALEKEFKKRGLFMESLLVRNITLPTPVKSSIEQKIQAEQDAQKMRFVLQKESQEAERKRVEAKGISDYQRIISESLTDRQLQYEQIKAMKELALSGNAKVIVMGKGNAPIILDSK